MEVSKKLELFWPHVNRAWCSAMLQRRYCHQAGIFMQLLWVIDSHFSISVPPHRAAICVQLFLETQTRRHSLTHTHTHTHTLARARVRTYTPTHTYKYTLTQ